VYSTQLHIADYALNNLIFNNRTESENNAVRLQVGLSMNGRSEVIAGV